MDWTKIKEQRDSDGNLTPLALACDALEDYGCDCGTDEPGTCLACRCEAAIEDLSARLAKANYYSCHRFEPTEEKWMWFLNRLKTIDMATKGETPILSPIRLQSLVRFLKDALLYRGLPDDFVTTHDGVVRAFWGTNNIDYASGKEEW